MAQKPSMRNANSKRPNLLRPILIGLGVVLVLVFGAAAMSGSFKSDKNPSAASFTITNPAANATVASPVKLSVAVKDSTLGAPTDGLDHLHVAVDGGEPEAIYDNRDRVLSLPPGPHTVIVDLAGPDHQSVLPMQTVSFVVR